MVSARSGLSWRYVTQVVVKELAKRRCFAARRLTERSRKFIGLSFRSLIVTVLKRAPGFSPCLAVLREHFAGGVNEHPHPIRALLSTDVTPRLQLPSAGHQSPPSGVDGDTRAVCRKALVTCNGRSGCANGFRGRSAARTRGAF